MGYIKNQIYNTRVHFTELFLKSMGKSQLTRQQQKHFKNIVDKHIDGLEDNNNVRFDCFGAKNCIKEKCRKKSTNYCFEVKDDCIDELSREEKQRAYAYGETKLRFVIGIQQFRDGKTENAILVHHFKITFFSTIT
mgnify:CR=1 FL=1